MNKNYASKSIGNGASKAAKSGIPQKPNAFKPKKSPAKTKAKK